MATNLTVEQLKEICPTVKNAETFVPVLNEQFDKFDMVSPYRMAMFLAQTLHESGGFRYVKEIWGPTTWQVKYEGHTGLGNNQPGDGKKFLGRGLIQLTGRANYTSFASWVGQPDILDHPEKVETPELAVLSAIWFWQKNKLNDYADNDDIVGCTKKVNGKAMLGLDERTKFYEAAKNTLGKD